MGVKSPKLTVILNTVSILGWIAIEQSGNTTGFVLGCQNSRAWRGILVIEVFKWRFFEHW